MLLRLSLQPVHYFLEPQLSHLWARHSPHWLRFVGVPREDAQGWQLGVPWVDTLTTSPLSVCNDENPCEGMSRHATFENFGMAFLTLFQVSTGDNWNGIMKVFMGQLRGNQVVPSPEYPLHAQCPIVHRKESGTRDV